MSVEPDYIAEANAFRARCPAKPVAVGRAVWRVIDTGAVSGGQSLLLCPGTLGNADIFRKVIEESSRWSVRRTGGSVMSSGWRISAMQSSISIRA